MGSALYLSVRTPSRLLCSAKMDPVGFTQSKEIRCDSCHQIKPGYEMVNYGSVEHGYRRLCSQCFHTEVATADGLGGFEHANFEPVHLVDCTGKAHKFHFRTRLLGTGVALYAFELRGGCPSGYRFQIIGNPREDLLALLGRLIEKMRRALSTKHLEDGELGLRIAAHGVVRGMVEWDAAGDAPLLVIDGREVTWDEFSRMLMSFEGWQFKLNLDDKSEEL